MTEVRPPILIISDGSYYSDDAVAIAAILSSRRFDVRGIVTTAGNVSAEQSQQDLQRLVAELNSSDVPVIRGPSAAVHAVRQRYYEEVERPSWREPSFVGVFEQATSAPQESSSAEDYAGANFVIEQAHSAHGHLSIVLLGPATVLRQALDAGSDLRLKNVYAMGGAFDVPGNVTSAAEFNVWFDPEAWDRLVQSDLRVTLTPLDATLGVIYSDQFRREQSENARLQHASEYVRRSSSARVPMWDEVVAATLIDPSLIVASHQARVSVAMALEPGYGKTSDQRGSGNVVIITAVDPERVEAVLLNALTVNRSD